MIRNGDQMQRGECEKQRGGRWVGQSYENQQKIKNKTHKTNKQLERDEFHVHTQRSVSTRPAMFLNCKFQQLPQSNRHTRPNKLQTYTDGAFILISCNNVQNLKQNKKKPKNHVKNFLNCWNNTKEKTKTKKVRL